METLVLQDLLDQLGVSASLATKDLRVHQEIRDRQEIKDHKVALDSLVSQG